MRWSLCYCEEVIGRMGVRSYCCEGTVGHMRGSGSYCC